MTGVDRGEEVATVVVVEEVMVVVVAAMVGEVVAAVAAAGTSDLGTGTRTWVIGIISFQGLLLLTRQALYNTSWYLCYPLYLISLSISCSLSLAVVSACPSKMSTCIILLLCSSSTTCCTGINCKPFFSFFVCLWFLCVRRYGRFTSGRLA